MTTETGHIALSMAELRAVARFAAECAEEVLTIFEDSEPQDARPREAIDAAWTFARGGPRGKTLRVTALGAHRAARDTVAPAAAEAARAAGHAAAAAYLHPLAKATQVKHILGAPACAARAVELLADDDPQAGTAHIEQARQSAVRAVVDVLQRYPEAPAGGGRVGELLRELDHALQSRD